VFPSSFPLCRPCNRVHAAFSLPLTRALLLLEFSSAAVSTFPVILINERPHVACALSARARARGEGGWLSRCAQGNSRGQKRGRSRANSVQPRMERPGRRLFAEKNNSGHSRRWSSILPAPLRRCGRHKKPTNEQSTCKPAGWHRGWITESF